MKKIVVLMLIVALFLLVKFTAAQTREQTTIQTATFAKGPLADAVTVSYLNFPWGEVTFSTIEKGTKGSYYGERTWPFAQMDNKVPLTFEGTKLIPGQYALVITPGGENKPMSLSVVPFEGPTFLKAGNIFSTAPKGEAVYTKDISFDTVDALADHMKIDLAPTASGFDLVLNYGNRKLTKSFETSTAAPKTATAK
ncbi:MAG: hypothetical protein PHX83_15325 [Acidobacteriia bacterium]|nr:hypothetical protein [Terriglobia bacterium]